MIGTVVQHVCLCSMRSSLAILCVVCACGLHVHTAEEVVNRKATPGPVCNLHPAIIERIRKDLEPWRESGITDDLARNISRQFPADHSNHANVMRVLIDNGTVYLNSILRRMKDFGFGPEAPGYLLDIWETSQRYQLPNVELAFQPEDEPPQHTYGRPGPLGRLWSFGHAKSDEAVREIVVPSAGHCRCVADGIDALMKNPSAAVQVPWEERKQVALGRATGFCPFWTHQSGSEGFFTEDKGTNRFPPCPRTKLVNLSASHTDLLDIKNPGEGHHVPMAKQLQWRYLVATDGFTVSTKLEKYMTLGATVLKQHSRRYAYFYDAIKPFEHYVPFFVDNATDILQAVQWLRLHDKEALAIAQAGKQFAQEHLSRPARLCYWKTLIEEWAKLFKYTPSCKQRKMCVPVIDELNYIGHYRPHGCINIHEQIDEVMGGPVPHGEKIGEKYGDVIHQYGHPHWAPVD